MGGGYQPAELLRVLDRLEATVPLVGGQEEGVVDVSYSVEADVTRVPLLLGLITYDKKV